MSAYLFKNFQMLEPSMDEVRDGYQLITEGGLIKEVSDKPISSASATVIDCGGKTLMPGLIDSHVHVYLSEVSIPTLEKVPLTLMTARGAKQMKAMLDRGFTTVRDTGGADWGIKQAVAEGALPGPRLYIAGRPVGPSGGHSDPRRRTDSKTYSGMSCFCCNAMAFTHNVADGVDNVRRAVREEMRQGVDHIKLMMSGGVASPYDPLDSLQLSPEEVTVAVQEAESFGRYVTAHAYTPEAITRAAQCGVRGIEHGNLIDEPAARLMAEKGMFLTANLVAYYAMRERAAQFGMNADMLAKNELVIDGGLRSLEICKRAGVPVAYGSDLLGQLQVDQSREFLIRSEVMPHIEIIRSATLIGARLLRMEGKLGTLKAGAFADLLLISGNPLKNLGLFQDQGAHMPLIMQDGKLYKHAL